MYCNPFSHPLSTVFPVLRSPAVLHEVCRSTPAVTLEKALKPDSVGEIIREPKLLGRGFRARRLRGLEVQGFVVEGFRV